MDTAARVGKTNAAEPAHCPYIASDPATKTAHHRDCYFAGVHGDAQPALPKWYADAPT